MNNREWWKNAVIYQIYPKSFMDSNHDGIGDLQGIIQKLNYLEQLGIDAIWLSPVYYSPQIDNGYDISDYQGIDPMFGSMEDMEQLITEARKHGIGIIMDLVLNHSSNKHKWFLEAVKSKDNPYHDYYVWRDGSADQPPNDMKACFGGTAWEWVPELGQYYFHQFAVEQPDLNWENPHLRKEIYEMITWWMKKGIAGFRLDVIDQIAKEPDRKITNNGPKLHEYLREMSRETFQKGNLVTVGEAWGATPELAKFFSNPDGSELSMVFQFEHIMLDQKGASKWDISELNLPDLKRVFSEWQVSLHQKGWNSLFWNNHDTPRIVSRWGNDKGYRTESATMLATILFGLEGTPYIYQGEEIGMTNTAYEIGEYQDIEIQNFYKERIAAGYPVSEIMRSIHKKGRDNARTPMQWNREEYSGFTDVAPWLKVNPNYQDINVEMALKDSNSIFYYYQKMIQLRKKYDVFKKGEYRMLFEADEDIFAYTRTYGTERLLVVANFHEKPKSFQIPWENYQVLAHNYMDSPIDELRPYEAYMLYKKEESSK